jgi:cytidylate kinase
LISVAIDGPAGAGKSTLSRKAAAELGFIYVDTGALYRTVGYFVYANGKDPHNADEVEPLLQNINIELKYENGLQRVILNGEDLGDKIRMPQMSMYASAVSSLPSVREFLLEMQKSIARNNSVVMDGRDIGTVIMPDADLKIFLTASNETRANRRTLELQAKGICISFEEVLNDMLERDKQDKNRDVAPAVPAEDAIIFDNSGMSVEESLAEIVRLVNERK